jgi:pimeloyl-ACP methyl ester carboxylesterase
VTLGMYRTFITREAFDLASGRWAGRLTVPTLVMVGEGDVVANAEGIRNASKPYADDLTVEEVKGARHFLPEEQPQAVVDRALEFFA